MISKKHNKKVCTTLNYTEHFLILSSKFSGCISISAFSCLVGILSFAIRLNIFETTVAIIKYNLTIKKKMLINSILLVLNQIA